MLHIISYFSVYYYSLKNEMLRLYYFVIFQIIDDTPPSRWLHVRHAVDELWVLWMLVRNN